MASDSRRLEGLAVCLSTDLIANCEKIYRNHEDTKAPRTHEEEPLYKQVFFVCFECSWSRQRSSAVRRRGGSFGGSRLEICVGKLLKDLP